MAAREISITNEPEGALAQAISDAAKGDRIVYHIGAFCAGRHRRDAAKAYEAGVGLLCCRRVRAGAFAYMVVKC